MLNKHVNISWLNVVFDIQAARSFHEWINATGSINCFWWYGNMFFRFVLRPAGIQMNYFKYYSVPSIKSSRTRIRKRMSMYFTNSETCRNLCKSVRQTSPAYTDIKFLLAIFLPPISLEKNYHKYEKCTYYSLVD